MVAKQPGLQTHGVKQACGVSVSFKGNRARSEGIRQLSDALQLNLLFGGRDVQSVIALAVSKQHQTQELLHIFTAGRAHINPNPPRESLRERERQRGMRTKGKTTN